MPVLEGDLVWLRLVKASRSHPRSAGDAEVLAWPALHVVDTHLRDVLYSALYTKVHGNSLGDVAHQVHGVSSKTFRRRRQQACAEIARGVNCDKWAELVRMHGGVCSE